MEPIETTNELQSANAPPSKALLAALYGKPANYVTRTGSEYGILYSFNGTHFLLFAPNTSKPGSKIPLAELEKIVFNGRDLTPSCDLWHQPDNPNEGKII